MYRFIVLLIFCTSFFAVQAQHGIQVGATRVTGNFANFVHPTGFGLDYVYRAMDEDRLVMGFSIGAYRFTTSQDTFFTRERNRDGTSSQDSVTVWESFRGNHYFIVPIAIGLDYKLGFGDLSPFVGGEVILSVAAFQRDYKVQFNSPQTAFGDVNIAIAPRLGLYYIINDSLAMSAGISRNFTAQLFRSEGHYKAFVNVFSWF